MATYNNQKKSNISFIGFLMEVNTLFYSHPLNPNRIVLLHSDRSDPKTPAIIFQVTQQWGRSTDYIQSIRWLAARRY